MILVVPLSGTLPRAHELLLTERKNIPNNEAITNLYFDKKFVERKNGFLGTLILNLKKWSFL